MLKKEKMRQGKEITELTVKHLNEKINFVYPPFGPNSYFVIDKQIQGANLKRQTLAEMVSLVHDILNVSDEAYPMEEIKKLMESRFIEYQGVSGRFAGHSMYCFQGVLYVLNEEVYIQDLPEVNDCVGIGPFGVKEGDVVMSKSNLVEKLKGGDDSVRFIPFEFKIGEQTAGEIARNPLVIALAGKEGAEKLAEVSRLHDLRPGVSCFENKYVPYEIRTVIALNSDSITRKLDILANINGDAYHACAFGML